MLLWMLVSPMRFQMLSNSHSRLPLTHCPNMPATTSHKSIETIFMNHESLSKQARAKNDTSISKGCKWKRAMWLQSPLHCLVQDIAPWTQFTLYQIVTETSFPCQQYLPARRKILWKLLKIRSLLHFTIGNTCNYSCCWFCWCTRIFICFTVCFRFSFVLGFLCAFDSLSPA